MYKSRYENPWKTLTYNVSAQRCKVIPSCSVETDVYKTSSRTREFTLYTSGYTQKPPFIKTLPFFKAHGRIGTTVTLQEFAQQTCERWESEGWYNTIPVLKCKVNVSTTKTGVAFMPIPPAYGPTVTNATKNKLRLELAESVKDARAQAPVTATEIAGTIDSMSERLRNIGRAMWALRKLNVRKALKIMGYSSDEALPALLRRTSRRAASDRLEYAYMWAPTLDEVRNVARTTAELMILGKPPEVKVKKRTLIRKTVTLLPDGPVYTYEGKRSNYGGYPDSMTIRRKSAREEIEEWYTLWARFRLVNAKVKHLDELGLINPLETLWELIPFSFIVDQFISIGSYLQSLTAYVGMELIDAGESSLVTTRHVGLLCTKDSSGLCDSDNTWYKREPVSMTGLIPHFPYDGFKVQQSMNRLLNNAALIRVCWRDK